MSAGDLTHLHPVIRDLAQADDAARLLAIRSKRWITHQPAARVNQELPGAEYFPLSGIIRFRRHRGQ